MRILAASVLAVGLATIAEAQILYGSVVGVVRDGTGAVMPGATVTIVNRDTNLTRETTTNSEGAYSIINVLPGPYDVKVTLAGAHPAEVRRDHSDAAQSVPELSGASQSGARHDADGIRQRGNRHARAVAGDERERAAEHAELDAHRRRDEHEHLAAEPSHVRVAGRDGRYGRRVDQQLRCGAGDGGRRRGDGHHQVGHE
ncbi:MAG: hypothetical protein DMG04_04890 [Acidobacteria bacterium]|nr:MAG: hypothetical protein DMG04_04890 [Acidobacteriota bacterium]